MEIIPPVGELRISATRPTVIVQAIRGRFIDYGDRDRHVRRGADDYTNALMSLLPLGQAWPRERGSVLSKVVAGLAAIYGYIDDKAATLLERESDPRLTFELLPDWERAWGLPDKCLAEPLTIADRQIALVHKMTMIGGQSRAFFIALAESIGYIIHIREYSPWVFGISECGMTDDGTGTDYPMWEIGPPEMRFYWTVFVDAVRLTWWRYGQAELGVDPHLRISISTDLECIFRRYKPAHTEVIFDYSGILRKTIRPGKTDLAFSSEAPSLKIEMKVPTGDVVIQGFAPTLVIEFKFFFWPDTADLLFTSTEPNLGNPGPDAAFLDISGFAPDVSRGVFITPPQGNLAFSGTAPGLIAERTLVVPTGDLAFSSVAPEAEFSVLLLSDGTSYLLMADGTTKMRLEPVIAGRPEGAQLELSGTGPQIGRGFNLSPANADLVISTTAPSRVP